MSNCLACDSIAAGSAPGGCIHETGAWFVDHCVGPLGVGTLIVKPKRHVVHVADLDATEAGELGPLLRQTTEVVSQVEMLDRGVAPDPGAAAAFAARARDLWP